MGTSIIDCVDGTIHVEEGYLLTLDLYHFRLTGSDFTGAGYFDISWHNSPPDLDS
jgi:hypothetical protein